MKIELVIVKSLIGFKVRFWIESELGERYAEHPITDSIDRVIEDAKNEFRYKTLRNRLDLAQDLGLFLLSQIPSAKSVGVYPKQSSVGGVIVHRDSSTGF